MDTYTDAMVCYCCAATLANGECCEDHPSDERAPLSLLDGQFVTPNWDEGDWDAFRYAPVGGCEGCGSMLAGTFVPVAVWA